MNDKSATPSVDGIQKMQIEEWLRQADKHIRAGRYFVADEELQKVFTVDPDNDIASSYEDRIQFLIKQLSQRVGMNVELSVQIRKYNEIIAERKVNRINSFLVKAQRAIEEGFLKKASDAVRRALALDPQNVYALALRQRIGELQRDAAKNPALSEAELKFRALLTEMWKYGNPTEAQKSIIMNTQQQLKIGEANRLVLERQIKNAFYKEALHGIWNTGGISAFTTAMVEQLRGKYSVSIVDHSAIEAALLKEVRKNKVKATILVVDEDETLLLDIAHHLRTQSYAVVAAATIEEALTVIKDIVPDIILSEINFNKGPLGFELFQFIRSSQTGRTTPFLFMTPSLDKTTAIIGKRLGVDEFIAKPVDYEMLTATIMGKMLRTSTARNK